MGTSLICSIKLQLFYTLLCELSGLCSLWNWSSGMELFPVKIFDRKVQPLTCPKLSPTSLALSCTIFLICMNILKHTKRRNMHWRPEYKMKLWTYIKNFSPPCPPCPWVAAPVRSLPDDVTVAAPVEFIQRCLLSLHLLRFKNMQQENAKRGPWSYDSQNKKTKPKSYGTI